MIELWRDYICINIYIYIVDEIVRQFVPPFARIFAIQPTVLDILRSRRMAGSDKGVEEGRALAFARRKMKFSATKRVQVCVCVCVCMRARRSKFSTRDNGELATLRRRPVHFYSTLADYGKRELVQRFPSTEAMERERERERFYWKIK